MTSIHDRQRPLRATRLDHVAINVSDLSKSCSFYTLALRLSEGSRSMFKQVLVGPNFSLHLFQAPEKRPVNSIRDWRNLGIQHLALTVTYVELERAIDVIRQLGGEIDGPIDDSDGRSLYFRDPDGNVVELRSQTQ